MKWNCVTLLAALLFVQIAVAQSNQLPGPAANPSPTPPPSKVASRPAKPVLIRVEVGAVTAILATPSDVVQVGALMPFTLTVESREGASISMPDLGSTLGPFEIRDVRRDISPAGLDRKSILSFVATTYESGLLELPLIEIDWTDAAGVRSTISLGPTAIEVVSLIGAEFDPNIFRDIKGEVGIDTGINPALIIAAVAFVLLGAFAWIFIARKRSITGRGLTPAEWALQELDRLEREGLVDRGDFHGFWVRLSGTVREYVERRFEIAAPEQTTKEFLAQAKDHPMIGAEHRHILADFLRAADMVKFAAHRPAERECASGLGAARDFIRDTEPTTDAKPGELAVRS